MSDQDTKMERPYIICHMTTSIDGKVTGAFLGAGASEPATEVYYEINRNYGADAFACGRVTMEGSFTRGWKPDLTAFSKASVERKDHVANRDAGFFAVAFDRKGRLGWRQSRIEDEDPGYGNAHIIEVLCSHVSDAYLAYLQRIGVSYIFAGEQEMNLPLALKKLRELFGIEKMLLEGGSILNGAFQRENVIDELSLVVAPVVAETGDRSLFDRGQLGSYQLQDIKRYEPSVLWLNYVKE